MKSFFRFSILFLFLGNFNANAQSFSYALTGDPMITDDWLFGGDATVVGESMRLTRAVGDLSGYVHYGTPQVLSGICAYFTVEFEYKMSPVSGVSPADGIAFWFLEEPPTGFVSGGGIGMPAPMNGFGLVFDTYNNDGVANNPLISLRSFDFDTWDEGDLSGVIGAELYSRTELTNSNWNHVRIEYIGGNISVFLNYNPVAEIEGTLDIDGIEGYFGFSASTGGAHEVHEIKNVYIAGIETPPTPEVTVTNKRYCEGSDVPPLAVDAMLADGILHWYTTAVGGTELGATPIIDGTVVGIDTYYVSQSTDFCALESERVQIIVNVRPLPSIDLTASATQICMGGTVDLEAVVTPEPDDEFIIGWTPAAGMADPTALNQTVAPTIFTNYVLTVNSGVPGCEATANAGVSVLPNTMDLINNDTVVCAGTSLPLTVIGHPAFDYRWTPETYVVDPMSTNTAMNASESGMVYITAGHDGCPDIRDSFYLEVQPVPKVNLGDDIVICSGDTAQLYAATTPTYSGYTYQWSPGLKLTDSLIKNPVFNGFSSEDYVVAVRTPYGCISRDTIKVTVNNAYFLKTNFEDTIVCGDFQLQLEASGAQQYQWYPSEGLSEDSIANPMAHYGGSMTYMVVGTSIDGCLDTQIVNITLAPDAITSLPDSIEIYPGERVAVDMVSNASYFQWFPPEGLDATNIANPTASPDIRTRYYVWATTEHGCRTLDSVDVVVNLESIFDLPNAFVPGNNFSNNGSFKIKGRGNYDLDVFRIYNRWGNLVFETTDINEGWDGTLDGKAQPQGVYVYQIAVKLASGAIIKKDGNVTLVR